MNNSIQNRIETIRREGYDLDFGRVFEHAFKNYKKIALYGGLVLFVFFVIISIAIFGVVIASFGAAAVMAFLQPENLKIENFDFNSLLIVSTASIVLGALLSPLTAGLIKMAYCAEHDEEFHVSTMFEFYKAPYFKELFIATFLVSIVSNVISSIITYAQIPVLNFIVSVAIALFTIIMIPLIIFGKLKAVQAIEASVIIVSKQPLTILGLLVVCVIAAMLGFIGCCIGIFFTLPLLYSLYYAIYNEIIGFDNENKVDVIL